MVLTLIRGIFSETILSNFGLGDRILVCHSEEPLSFVESVRDFHEKLTPSPIRRNSIKKKEELNLSSLKFGKRDVILDAIRSISVKVGVHPDITVDIDNSIPFRDAFIDKTCTICDACTEVCKTGALKKDLDKINFIYGYCIACGLCKEVCPEDAIKLNNVLDFAKLVDLKENGLVESELLECRRCGRPYIAKSALDRISDIIIEGRGGEFDVESHLDLLGYCESCRPLIAFEKVKGDG